MSEFHLTLQDGVYRQLAVASGSDIRQVQKTQFLPPVDCYLKVVYQLKNRLLLT